MFGASLYRPMTPSGGAFLVCVGALLLVGSMHIDQLGYFLMTGFAAGVAAMIVTIIVCIRLRLLRPSTFQRMIFLPIIGIEIAAMLIVQQFLPRDVQTIWIAALIITGLHFLPMYWSFGWLIVGLGVACTVAATAGAMLGLLLPTIVVIDGALKIAFGLAMFSGLFGGRLARPAA